MYLQATKTMLVQAMRSTFDSGYLAEQFRNINIGIEFPVEPQNYPGVWVDFEPMGEMERAGINHTEYMVHDSGFATPFTRYRFAGYATYTVVAMTSRERDALFDEVVRVFGFGDQHSSTRPFREAIEDNELIAMNMEFDTIGQRGFAASPGTPWNTDEVIYEATVSMNLIGEFVADQATGLLGKITEIRVHGMVEGQPDDSGW